MFHMLPAKAQKMTNVQYARSMRCPVVSRTGALGGALTECLA